jgi:hypothetical protein
MDSSRIPGALEITWPEKTEENRVNFLSTASYLVYILTVYLPVGSFTAFQNWSFYHHWQNSPVVAIAVFLFFVIFSGVRLSPLDTATTIGLLYQPQMIDDGDCGEIGGMKKIGRAHV